MIDTTVKSNKKIFGIGASGLIGSRVAEQFIDTYPITNLSTKTGVNITDPESLSVIENDTEHTHVILFAAKADVDGCEKDKALGRNGDAWKINVDGAENVAQVCRKSGKKLIYISTDFVFSGSNAPEGGYDEQDEPDPINWYATTKYEGEKAVKRSGAAYVIARIAYPYRRVFEAKKDFVHAIAGRLREGLPVQAVTDHIMTPTYVDDIAAAIQKLIETDNNGLYHVVGSEFITPYEAASAIASEFGFAKDIITKTTREQFFQDRAPRPFNLSLKNDKIEHLGVEMRTFREGLRELKTEMESF
jgi:dTDP-4-dehydrorhamnose reductase